MIRELIRFSNLKLLIGAPIFYFIGVNELLIFYNIVLKFNNIIFIRYKFTNKKLFKSISWRD